ncbi:MAG: transposase [Chthoniobacteraceae bacterium]|nr:transposase [Chthoniobacteraceae bacterium]
MPSLNSTRRWQTELNFDDIKTALAMDHLHCKTPSMVACAILIFQCAYNTIRILMLEAAISNEGPLRRPSFKGERQRLG